MTSHHSVREIESIAGWMIETSLSKGVLMADVLYTSGDTTHFSLRDGSPERDTQGSSFRIGCRMIDGEGRQGVAEMNSLSRDELEKMIGICLQNCKASEPETDITLYKGTALENGGPFLFDPDMEKVDHPGRESRCMEMHRIASSMDKRVVSVRDASWVDGSGSTMYATSEGFLGWYEDTYAACSVTVVMSEGESFEMAGSAVESRRIGDIDHSVVARESVERAALTLGGSPLATGVYNVVLDPEAASSLVESVGELFLASSVFKHRSLLKDRMGESVGSGCLTIVDDGTLPWGLGSSPWDGEGVPTGRTILMEKGKVCSFLNNLKYAKKFGVSPTGNASRYPGSIPGVGFSNLFVEPGERAHSRILRDNCGGVLVTELMGVHTIDPVSGDFSLGIKGALIESDGTPGKPVAGMTIAGNLVDLLGSITEVGRNLRFFGGIGGCTMVVRDVSMAGS